MREVAGADRPDAPDVAGGKVIPLGERLRLHRVERGMSQAQAARELDVARTAYRLWEMEAAKPAPDRWRLIARWLGVSVTTMLLAEDLLSDDEAAVGELVATDFARSGRDWDTVGAANEGDFFSQARALVEDAAVTGEITADHAAALASAFQRIEADVASTRTGGWEAAGLRKSFAADERAPRSAREALSVVAEDLPEGVVENARLLVSELVTNAIIHARTAFAVTLVVSRHAVRLEVSDRSPAPPVIADVTCDGDSGRGLRIVAGLAHDWGVTRDPAGGKSVWASVLTVPRQRT